MDYSTGIAAFDRTYEFNAVDNYNKFLQNNSSFIIDDSTPTDFEKTLENAQKSFPIHDKKDPEGLGNFANKMGTAFSNGLNSINNAKLEADRLQEDLAMGGPTTVHDAMIAAEKASLSMQMAVQVRNRIVAAYKEITSMAV